MILRGQENPREFIMNEPNPNNICKALGGWQIFKKYEKTVKQWNQQRKD